MLPYIFLCFLISITSASLLKELIATEYSQLTKSKTHREIHFIGDGHRHEEYRGYNKESGYNQGSGHVKGGQSGYNHGGQSGYNHGGQSGYNYKHGQESGYGYNHGSSYNQKHAGQYGYSSGHYGKSGSCGNLCHHPDGLFPHPTDCCSFVNCAHCREHIQQCGPGTHFSPSLKVCDFPHRAGCHGNKRE